MAELFSNLALGFGVAFTPINLLLCLIGALVGTLVGVLPGIGTIATVAMLLPITFGLPPVGARSVLRTTTAQPFEPRNYASPLTGFRTYWQKPKTDDVLLTVRGLPTGSRIRIAQ